MIDAETPFAKYPKIDTIYKRDPHTKRLLIGQWTTPELEYLQNNEWVWTEKIDGTNIRLQLKRTDTAVSWQLAGRTEKAQLPAQLTSRLTVHLNNLANTGVLSSVFTCREPNATLTIYGEGYGAGIQSGGNYRQDQWLVIFDVRAGNWWLRRGDVETIATQLGFDIVPIVGNGTLHPMRIMVHSGFKSRWGDFPAEGIVARPAVELSARNGQRIICKLKTKDFAE